MKVFEYPKINFDHLEKILFERFSEDGFLSLKNLPSPTLFKDMHRATQRIVEAIRKKEKIILIGDYDVDGVTATTLMKLFFDAISVELQWIIPNRFRDGYGLSPSLIPQISNYDLAITVDNGISATQAAALCVEIGVDLIITDHHLIPPLLPQAYAIIDQKQEECNFPYNEICGAQIAWYLIASLKEALGVTIDTKSYLQFVAIAIIADIMPLKHINRAMVIAGLQLLERSEFPSIRAFREHISKESLTSEDIAFWLAPLLNSAGRMSDASFAVEFLLSPNIYDAREKLAKLIQFNENRKATEEDITNQALSKANPIDSILVLQGEEWHEGVVGIVAARVAKEFQKPTIILSQSNKTQLKGSGRSYGVCDLFEVTSQCRNYLEKFGGHKSAIGLSLCKENFESFKEALQQSYEKQNYTQSNLDEEILGELSFSEITFELADLIKKYEPFGHQNSRPKFISKDTKIIQVDSIGKEKNHLRFALEESGQIFVALKFKSTESYSTGDMITISYTINVNNFRGESSLQLLIDKIY